jgi:hypothetical protein
MPNSKFSYQYRVFSHRGEQYRAGFFNGEFRFLCHRRGICRPWLKIKNASKVANIWIPHITGKTINEVLPPTTHHA